MTVTRLCLIAVAAIATQINGQGEKPYINSLINSDLILTGQERDCDVTVLTGVFQTTYSTLMGVAEQAGGLFGDPNYDDGSVFIIENGVGGPGTLLVYGDYRNDIGNKSAYLGALCVQPPGSNYRKCVNLHVNFFPLPQNDGGFYTVTATKVDDNCTAIENTSYGRVPAFDSNNRDVFVAWDTAERIGEVPSLLGFSLVRNLV